MSCRKPIHLELVMSMTLDEMKTLDEKAAAEILGVKVKTIQGWRWAKIGPKYLKIGRLVRYRISDLMAYLDKQTVNPEN